MASRPLTPGEIALARPLFGERIDYAAVRLHRRRWWPLQPAHVCMAPDGHLWFAATGDLWRDDFSTAGLGLTALFVHELTHVWQAQRAGRWWLPLVRHPFCRYRYGLRDGWPLERYGVEQQAEIVKDAWLARTRGAADARLEALLPIAADYPVRPYHSSSRISWS